MDLIISLQNLATPFITIVLLIFDFLGQTSFFVLLFAILYLFINKEIAYKYLLSYEAGFAIGVFGLKNIIKRSRPYAQNLSLLSTRASYGYSLPSESSLLVATSNKAISSAVKAKSKIKTAKHFWLSLSLFFVWAIVCFSQLYFAESYLLDVIVGGVLGLLISFVIMKFVKISKKFINIFTFIILPMLTILFAFVAKDSFTNNFSNKLVFEFVGICFSLSFGYFVEQKFIKYQPKNNLIFTSFKLCITLIVLIGYYYLCKLLPGLVIYSLIKYFIAGLIVTLLLPMLFNKLEKYFYIFAPNISSKHVKNSYISLSENQTKKIANKILSDISLGDCILLKGDLGAGKSVIVRQMLKQSGVVKPVTSPTFTLVNVYFSPSGHFYHFDMYRLTDEEEVQNIGFEEILEDKNAIKFIEWPQKVENYLPSQYKQITVVKLSKKARNIIVEDVTI